MFTPNSVNMYTRARIAGVSVLISFPALPPPPAHRRRRRRLPPRRPPARSAWPRRDKRDKRVVWAPGLTGNNDPSANGHVWWPNFHDKGLTIDTVESRPVRCRRASVHDSRLCPTPRLLAAQPSRRYLWELLYLLLTHVRKYGCVRARVCVRAQ